jgi:heterodisulfide reductase subunit C
MDYHPDQIIRMAQLGLKKQVLSSSTIWLCASCETCVTRCPHDIDILRVMDTLREIALREKIKGKEVAIPVFHQHFLDSISRFGRPHELSLLLLLKLKTGDFLGDIGLGVKMLLKGKLKPLPHRVKGLKEIRAIFKKTEQGLMEDRKSLY